MNDCTKPFTVGIAGGSESGKSNLLEKIIKGLNLSRITVLTMDLFETFMCKESKESRIHTIDYTLISETLKKLKERKSVCLYVYDPVTQQEKTRVIESTEVIILKGRLSLYDPTVRDQLDIKIFVDTDIDIMLLRRIQKNIKDAQDNIQEILYEHQHYIKPVYDTLIQPSMKFADIIVSGRYDNCVAAQCVKLYIQLQFDKGLL